MTDYPITGHQFLAIHDRWGGSGKGQLFLKNFMNLDFSIVVPENRYRNAATIRELRELTKAGLLVRGKIRFFILDFLQTHKPCTCAGIILAYADCYTGGKVEIYASILKALKSLTEQGLIIRDTSRRPFLYKAVKQ